ncbi:MAG: alpha/beta hydrolase [Desulfobacula sp.]|nr:alpha/beta hydrolase [Desulfobacula sp.]
MPQNNANFSILDQPSVLNCLFHPRMEMGHRPKHPNRKDILIPVGDGIHVGASLHITDMDAPVVLYFHGNGEIVSDYDEIGMLFNRAGLNFFAVDYRGYGSSTGKPTVTAMMMDCHTIADFVGVFMAQNNMTGSLCVMGRSLGSASAIELAAQRPQNFKCLIIESGFAWASPLLQILGIDPVSIGFKEHQGFENIDKIKKFSKPCLIIHAQFDHIIPFSDGQALYDSAASGTKKLLEIKGANHNDILLKGMEPYMTQVKTFCCA